MVMQIHTHNCPLDFSVRCGVCVEWSNPAAAELLERGRNHRPTPRTGLGPLGLQQEAHPTLHAASKGACSNQGPTWLLGLAPSSSSFHGSLCASATFCVPARRGKGGWLAEHAAQPRRASWLLSPSTRLRLLAHPASLQSHIHPP